MKLHHIVAGSALLVSGCTAPPDPAPVTALDCPRVTLTVEPAVADDGASVLVTGLINNCGADPLDLPERFVCSVEAYLPVWLEAEGDRWLLMNAGPARVGYDWDYCVDRPEGPIRIAAGETIEVRRAWDTTLQAGDDAARDAPAGTYALIVAPPGLSEARAEVELR